MYVYEGQDLAEAKCERNTECLDLHCDSGLAYCKDGACGCSPSKVQRLDTNKVHVNHLGICDTDIECMTKVCSHWEAAKCINGKCECPKL